jgi:signal transduction histidine kinase
MVTAFSVLTVLIMAFFYSNYLFEERVAQTKEKMLERSVDLAFHIQSNLLDRLDVVKTMQSANEVQKALFKSNAQYENLSEETIKKKMSKLNKIWMSKKSKNDPFIKKYTNNKLANYLKKQEKVLPGLYGEIFITNMYGALVASTGKLTTLEHDYKYWWKESYDYGHGKVFFDDRGYDDSVHGYVVGIVSPVKKDGKIIGIIKANINVEALFGKSIKKHNMKYEEPAKIVRTKGLIVYEKNSLPLSKKVSPEVVKLLKLSKDGVAVLKIANKYKIVAYSPVKLSLESENIVFGGKKNSIDHVLGNDGEIWNIVIEKDKNIVFNKVLDDIKSFLNIGLGFILLLAIVLFVLIDKMSSPLYRLSKAVRQIGNGKKGVKIEPESSDEVGELAISFKETFEKLKRTTASRDELEKEMKKRVEAERELRKKDELLIAQSKQAAMGEMISMIAHQWRQPLSVISMAVNNILIDMELDELKEQSVKECSSEILEETQYLSQTIDDFRNFFKPNKEKEIVSLHEICDDTHKLIGKSLENNDIELNISGDLDQNINTHKNELLQVIINILSNAKDALADKQIKNKKISISTCKKEKNIFFEFCDNAGGIKEEIMDKIFDPYISTKEEKNGTGLGLYMSKTIVEKHLFGKIWVENTEEGACFMIELPIGEIDV